MTNSTRYTKLKTFYNGSQIGPQVMKLNLSKYLPGTRLSKENSRKQVSIKYFVPNGHLPEENLSMEDLSKEYLSREHLSRENLSREYLSKEDLPKEYLPMEYMTRRMYYALEYQRLFLCVFRFRSKSLFDSWAWPIPGFEIGGRGGKKKGGRAKTRRDVAHGSFYRIAV